ncbi:MAG TPA: VCBS repeat-containing protein, partial [Cyclobacteriaceae bacterium]
IGFGLGVTVGDVNNDNWPDIYVSNDFFERDYLYINNRNGTFSERLEDEIGHTSMFSMGADLADLNNDGYLDIFSTDMLPNDDYRLKTVASFESYDVYKLKVKNGYYHQYMRNMLQLNNQDGTFSEIGQFANVWATDWSWGALMADFNNDGNKEIFVANGILRDVTDQDFLDYMANEENIRAVLEGRKINYQKVIQDMPSHKLSNFMFIKDGELHYKNVSEEWGLSEPSFSNGSAYGDLDNDGDLDLVVNNVNQPLFVYRNENQLQNKTSNYLRLQFKGKGKNAFGLGAKVEVFTEAGIITHENMPIRGYQSSMDYKMIIGLGSVSRIDSMRIFWPDETSQLLTQVEVNKTLALKQDDGVSYKINEKYKQPLLQEVNNAINFVHHENDFNQFNAEKSIYQMVSTEGPAVAIGDLNNDNLDDFFVGGAHGQSGAIFIQRKEGTFTSLNTNIFDQDSLSESTDAIFFDADNDKDLDLYVVTGGSEPDLKSDNLLDILYLNTGVVNGLPVFKKSTTSLPSLKQNGSCVKATDYDNDGDEDIFIGTRSLIGKYGLSCDQFILQNDGHGKFTDVSPASPDLKSLGMVTDAQWFDYDKDGLPDLIVVGDWMPVTILINMNGVFKKLDMPSLKDLSGWWNTIEKSDIDGDGDLDFVLGNLGLNTKFKASKQEPVSLYVNDFDHNNSLQQIYTYRKDDVDFPFASKQELSRQINSINKKFVYHKNYAGKSINEIFSANQLEGSTVLYVNESRSGLLINDEQNHTFSFQPLPTGVQFSPVFDFQIADLNGDKNDDLICGGNLFSIRTEVGRYDASHGNVLLGDGRGEFKLLSGKDSGIKLRGEVRAIAALKGKDTQFLFGLNNDTLRLYKLSKSR